MPFTLATWNINSVRLREGLVARLLAEEMPDVLCLQECKSPVDKIPVEQFRALGYGHMVARGQKGYNGVAILSKLPLEDLGDRDFAGLGHARHVAARLPNGVVIHNCYIPAGGDIPDREVNVKFGQKLDWVAELRDWGHAEKPARSILVGDLNIAPREDDVWNHKQLLKIVSHTPVETELLVDAQEAGGWVDVTRQDIPKGGSIPGGPIARPTGTPPTRAAGWIMSGPRPTSPARRIPAASCAPPAAGSSRATTRRCSPASTSDAPAGARTCAFAAARRLATPPRMPHLDSRSRRTDHARTRPETRSRPEQCA